MASVTLGSGDTGADCGGMTSGQGASRLGAKATEYRKRSTKDTAGGRNKMGKYPKVHTGK